MSVTRFDGIYRGIVVETLDPEVKGRVKVFVPGVYPETLAKNSANLPWCELIMPIFGGSYKSSSNDSLNQNCGVCSVMLTDKENLKGSQVWVFFENGNHLFPKCFGVTQGGDNWLAEHKKQHVIQTENFSLIIDEDNQGKNLNKSINGVLSGEKEETTTQTDSNNTKCTPASRKLAQENMPVLVTMEINNPSGCALNLNIIGSVNISVLGNVYEEITGTKHMTLSGDSYTAVYGNTEIINKGNYKHLIIGDKDEIVINRTRIKSADYQLYADEFNCVSKGDLNLTSLSGDIVHSASNIIFDGDIIGY